MGSKHVTLGIVILAAIILFLAHRYFRAERRYPFPRTGWAGLAIIVGCEALLALRVQFVTVYFTPLAWTGYLLFVDALTANLQGSSLLQRSPRRFLALAAWSIPLWLIFEAYNLRLRNWTYVGLPSNLLARDIGYAWSFATIWPAIFETAEFVRALGFFRGPAKPRRPVTRRVQWGMAIAGLLCLTVPVALPPKFGSYFFGIVWVGFALLLDPVNYHGKGCSLLRLWEKGSTTLLCSFLFSGLICGFFWEFWNYWAHARWIYIFPILQRWKIFEMPAPGFLGFLPFAVECFVMYEFLRTLGRWLKSARHSDAEQSAAEESRCFAYFV
ncbi:MAG TPA: hypothetical protein VFZ08_11380 [Terriglobia bacterium]|nr:hypothetical protein [Terriglobia bacterium]